MIFNYLQLLFWWFSDKITLTKIKFRKEDIVILIVLAGTIGAGKSSLATELGKHFGTEVFYESVEDNPILDIYYSDPKRYAFLLQIYFLNKRFKSIKQAYYNDNNVLDRSIFEDALFLDINYQNGNVTSQERDIYYELLDNMLEELDTLPKKSPDLLIYIDVDFDTMLKRINTRGRDYEQVDSNGELLAYYKQVHSAYPDWYEKYNKSKKIRIDGTKYDFVNDKQSLDIVIKQVEDALK